MMWEQTGRLVWIWLRITFGLLAGLGVVWLVYGWHSAAFAVAALLAALIEVWAVRGLAREWSWLARGCWWWG
ncbi:MAG: hypothetical protein LC808_32135 [Actinobacteria bacterium]|nr:hypothetical protein [Actinomycetota bacterium]